MYKLQEALSDRHAVLKQHVYHRVPGMKTRAGQGSAVQRAVWDTGLNGLLAGEMAQQK